MNAAELRLKTSLLGFSGRDLQRIFTSMDDAADVLTGQAPVPARTAEIVSAWWEEAMTAVENTANQALQDAAAGREVVLTRYGRHHLLPSEQGAHASSLHAWDFHLGLIIQRLDDHAVPYRVETVSD